MMTFPHKIRHNFVLPIFQLAAGSFMLIVGLLIAAPTQLLLGGFFVLLGILYLSNPTLVITNQVLFIKNPLGMTLKKHTYTLDTIEVQGSKIMISGKQVFIASAIIINKVIVNKLLKIT